MNFFKRLFKNFFSERSSFKSIYSLFSHCPLKTWLPLQDFAQVLFLINSLWMTVTVIVTARESIKKYIFTK